MNTSIQSSLNSLCKLCNGDISNSLIPYNNIIINNFSGLFDNLNLCYCTNCGLGTINSQIKNELIFNFYEFQYRAKNSPFHINFKDVNDIHETFVCYSHRTSQQLLLVKEFCTFESNDIFLDIGPGAGGSFYIASSLLNEPQLFGIEISNGASEFYNRFPLNKINVLDSIEKFIELKKKAKVLLMSHSLEHYQIADLPDLFKNIKHAIDQEGILIIEVPNVDLRIHTKNRGADTPHLIFFSQKSLGILLEKYGFKVLFSNTCDQIYQEESNLTEQNSLLKIKNLIRIFYNKVPFRIQTFLRKFKKVLNIFSHKSNNPLLPSNLETIKSIHTNREHQVVKVKIPDNEVYGGNRHCIRVVAKLNKK